MHPIRHQIGTAIQYDLDLDKSILEEGKELRQDSVLHQTQIKEYDQ